MNNEKQKNYSMVPLNSRKKSYIVNLISIVFLIGMVYTAFGANFSKDIYVNLLGINFGQMRNLFFTICFTIVLAVSLNLTTGCLGEMVLGHAGFMVIGAYAGSLFLVFINSEVVNLVEASSLVKCIFSVLAMLIGFIFAGLAGLLVGIPALRLRGDYLAIITLGFGQIIVKLLNLSVFDFTNSDGWISNLQGPGGLKHIPENDSIILYAVVAIIVVALIFIVMRSRFGRAVLSIREDAIAAESVGIPVTKYKILTFMISAAFAGVAGVMYAQNLGYLDSKQFDFNYSVELLVIVVLGGLGSFTGSIISTIVLLILPESLRFLADYRLIIYSLSLIIIMLTKPSGLLGRYEFSMTRLLSTIKRFFLRIINKIFKKKGDSHGK